MKILLLSTGTTKGEKMQNLLLDFINRLNHYIDFMNYIKYINYIDYIDQYYDQ